MAKTPIKKTPKIPTFDQRNKLNDLTGKDWLKLTKSFWESERCSDDKDAFDHPAPFLIKDIEKLISFFTKKKMKVLDPFVGSGTTILASCNLKRFPIGIDLNSTYKKLCIKRTKNKEYVEKKDFLYLLGDSKLTIKKIDSIDYIVTSPPYHNILRNNGAGIRKEADKEYRKGSRTGIEFYSDKKNDLGNMDTYDEFLIAFKDIMSEAYKKLKNKKYCSIVISDFTVNKKEVCVQADIVNAMTEIGFEFVGTVILLQNSKPLYPFGYPYAYKINHHHQNIINFRKNIDD